MYDSQNLIAVGKIAAPEASRYSSKFPLSISKNPANLPNLYQRFKTIGEVQSIDNVSFSV